MVYTETKPRGPIFIDFTGPGPAYSLPTLIGTDHHDTRSNHSKAPSYSIGSRWKERKNAESNPGPIYNPKTSWINESGGISLKGRHSTRSRGSTGPGPGAYQPSFSWLSDNRTGPAYSIAGRQKTRRKKDDTPGPNAYTPSFGGHDGKGFSLKGRHRETGRGNDTPGPLQYKPGSGVIRYGRVNAPEASLKGRHHHETHDAVGPGPAAYNPHIDALSSSRGLPAWSLSSRHREPGGKDKSPGPQAYRPLPPSEVASAPAYSLQGKRRSRNITDDTPGPGLYNPDPSIGIRGRCEQKAPSLKGRPRERDPKKDTSPGPGAYNTDSPRDSGPAYSMAGKWKKKDDETTTPGPNKYFPSFHEEGPAYSLKGRHEGGGKESGGPGPGAYNIDKDLDGGPAYSIAGRWMADDVTTSVDNSPGPAAYYPQKKLVKDEGGISFGVRHSRAKLETAATKKIVESNNT